MKKILNNPLTILILNVVLIVAQCITNLFYQLPAPNWDLPLKFVTSGIFVLMGAINLIYALTKKNGNSKYSIVMFVALLFSFGGDVAIEYEFIAGAASFAIAHICFVVAFYYINKFHWSDVALGLLLAVPTVLVLALVPKFSFHTDPVLKTVSCIYGVIIAFMLAKSITTLYFKRNFLSLLTFIGAITFVISDVFLVTHRFISDANVWLHGCSALYFPALLVFAFTVYYQNKNILSQNVK